MTRRAGISKSNLTLSGAKPAATVAEHRYTFGGAFWQFSRDSTIRLGNPCCYKLEQTLPNDPVPAGCPGTFIFDKILWDQGPANMANFCRNFGFS